MVKREHVGFGSNGFVIKMQSFPIDGHYKTDIISDVGYPKLDLVVMLMAGALALYYRSLGTVSILLRRGDISGRLYC
jgi:hypothetical protein